MHRDQRRVELAGALVPAGYTRSRGQRAAAALACIAVQWNLVAIQCRACMRAWAPRGAALDVTPAWLQRALIVAEPPRTATVEQGVGGRAGRAVVPAMIVVPRRSSSRRAAAQRGALRFSVARCRAAWHLLLGPGEEEGRIAIVCWRVPCASAGWAVGAMTLYALESVAASPALRGGGVRQTGEAATAADRSRGQAAPRAPLRAAVVGCGRVGGGGAPWRDAIGGSRDDSGADGRSLRPPLSISVVFASAPRGQVLRWWGAGARAGGAPSGSNHPAAAAMNQSPRPAARCGGWGAGTSAGCGAPL